jgi:hypothetical protein
VPATTQNVRQGGRLTRESRKVCRIAHLDIR